MCQDAETPVGCHTPKCPYAHSVRVMNAWTTSRNAAASTKGGSDDHYRAGHGPAHNARSSALLQTRQLQADCNDDGTSCCPTDDDSTHERSTVDAARTFGRLLGWKDDDYDDERVDDYGASLELLCRQAQYDTHKRATDAEAMVNRRAQAADGGDNGEADDDYEGEWAEDDAGGGLQGNFGTF